MLCELKKGMNVDDATGVHSEFCNEAGHSGLILSGQSGILF